MKRNIRILLGVGFILSLLANGVLLYAYLQAADKPAAAITGTYYTGPQENADYLVLQDDGKFYQYKQYGTVTGGTWKEENDFYTLTAADGISHIFMTAKETSYLLADDASFLTYTKLSSVPSFVNVSIDDAK